MTEIITITFLGWAVVGGFCFLIGYWNGRRDGWEAMRKHAVDLRWQQFTGERR